MSVNVNNIMKALVNDPNITGKNTAPQDRGEVFNTVLKLRTLEEQTGGGGYLDQVMQEEQAALEARLRNR